MRRFLNILYADLRRLVRLPAFWMLSVAFSLLSPLPLLLRLPRLLSGYYGGFDATEGLFSFLPFIGLALAILLPFYLLKTDIHKHEMGLSNAITYASNLIVIYLVGIFWMLCAILMHLLTAELLTLALIGGNADIAVYWFRANANPFLLLPEVLCNLLAHAAFTLCICTLWHGKYRRLGIGIGAQLALAACAILLLPSVTWQLMEAGTQGGFLEYLGFLAEWVELLLPVTGSLHIALDGWLELRVYPHTVLCSLILALLATIPCVVPPPKAKETI